MFNIIWRGLNLTHIVYSESNPKVFKKVDRRKFLLKRLSSHTYYRAICVHFKTRYVIDKSFASN